MDTLALYKSGKTVFSSDDLAVFLGKPFSEIRHVVAYACKTGQIRRVHRSMYALSDTYDPLELAGKILRPSYISLGTVLRREWIIFQYSSEIHLISYKTDTITIDGHTLVFHSMKKAIRENPDGIEFRGNISIASKERAFLDSLYLFWDMYLDNLRSIDWEKCLKLAELYQSPTLMKRLISYQKQYAQYTKA